MKIIHVAGMSGSGKTTFIRELLADLAERGTVASVKHLGHHPFDLVPGKDTTVFYETGIRYSVGIDEEKSVRIARGGSLTDVLYELADAGVDYAVIEGFKSLPYPKIVFGEIAAEQVILRNPVLQQVIGSLHLFEDLFTMEGLARELRKSCREAGCVLAFQGTVGEELICPREKTGDFDRLTSDTIRKMEEMDGILGARIRFQSDIFASEKGHILVVVCARNHDQACRTLTHGLDMLKHRLHPARGALRSGGTEPKPS